jgi:hypothetical protein
MTERNPAILLSPDNARVENIEAHKYANLMTPFVAEKLKDSMNICCVYCGENVDLNITKHMEHIEQKHPIVFQQWEKENYEEYHKQK